MKSTFFGLTIALAFAAAGAYAGEPVWDGNKVVMTSEKLGDGVYAYYPKDAREINRKGGAAATSGGLIVGTKGALLIETMLNQRLNKQVQDLSRKLAHKPILYAINTSARRSLIRQYVHACANRDHPACEHAQLHCRAPGR